MRDASGNDDLSSDVRNAWMRKGDDCYRDGDYEQARDAYERASHWDENFVPAYIGKGNALNGLKRYKEALLIYDEKVLRLAPDSAAAYVGKGNSFYGLKNYDEALLMYEKAIELNPNSTLAYCGKGHT